MNTKSELSAQETSGRSMWQNKILFKCILTKVTNLRLILGSKILCKNKYNFYYAGGLLHALEHW